MLEVDSESAVRRILIVHPDESTRKSAGEGLRRVSAHPVALFEAGSAPAGLQSARRIVPAIVLLNLSDDRSVVLDVARELRRTVPLVIGLYNPLLEPERQSEFFRQAVRAGVGDFVPLPVADAELRAAMEAAQEAVGRHDATETARVVAFFSHKGGVGTSTLAVNTALDVAAADNIDRGVALCDAVLQFGSVAGLLGLSPDRDLGDLVRDLDTVESVAAHVVRDQETGLHVLASPADPHDAERIGPEELTRVLIGMRRRFGVIVVDLPSVLDLLTLAVLDLAERIVLVSEAVVPTVVTTGRAVRLLDELGFEPERLRVVINRHSVTADTPSEQMIREELGRPVDHIIASDPAVISAASRGMPLVLQRKRGAFSESISRLAADVLGLA